MMSHFSVLFPLFRLLMLLPPETASLREPGSAPSWLAEDSGTSGADDHSLGVTEDRGDPARREGRDYNQVEEDCWSAFKLTGSIRDT